MRVVATAGHVDHGKSSLVRALTGTDPDRFEEERRRGLTIDLGFAHTTLPSGEGISFIDVPGHIRFIRNMLAGVGGVDACLLVVAATEGWKPQTEEHLRILELLGVDHGLVVMTMSDLVDDEWLQLQQLEMSDHLAGSFLDGAPIVAFSSVTGAGHDDLLAALDDLVQATPPAPSTRRPRLWIDRVFAAKGSGTVVTGTLTGGALRVEQHLDVLPLGIDVRVRAIQTHGLRVEQLEPGNRAAVNLAGVDHDRLARGDALVVAAQWRPTKRFDASLHVLGALDHEVSRRGAYLAYIGSGELPARLRVLGDESIPPGGDGLVRVHLAERVPLVPGDRFVLRESGRSETVGGGEVLDVAPVLPASKARPDRSVARIVRERGVIAVDELAALTGRHGDVLLDGIEAPATVGPVPVGRWVIDPATKQAMEAHLRSRITDAAATGLDTAVLDEPHRAVLATLADVQVEGGTARLVGLVDRYADHPFTAALLAGGAVPPDSADVARNDLRELVRRRLIVERDGVHFHPATVDLAAQRAAELLRDTPDGFTMSQFRDALATSRKYALPLLNELDACGVTRRRGDVRVAGPRLPVLPPADP